MRNVEGFEHHIIAYANAKYVTTDDHMNDLKKLHGIYIGDGCGGENMSDNHIYESVLDVVLRYSEYHIQKQMFGQLFKDRKLAIKTSVTIPEMVDRLLCGILLTKLTKKSCFPGYNHRMLYEDLLVKAPQEEPA